MLKKYILFAGILLSGYSTIASADDIQKFYDDGYDLMLEFRKCSVITNQLSNENSACLAKAEISIKNKLKSFEITHKVDIEKANNSSNNLKDDLGFVQTQKNNCVALYPSPLRSIFKNQIKSCQIQVDLNRYLYVANTILGY